MITRRQWLAGSLSLISAQIAAGCGSDGASSHPSVPEGGTGPDGGGSLDGGGRETADEGGTPDDLFARLRSLRASLRESPDHLEARADALVARKDAKAIFEFVRDSIAVVPPLSYRDAIETSVRFGVDNVLRAGAGTPRERAEVLSSLLGRAGFQAAVVSGNPAGPLLESGAPAKVYLRDTSQPFEPGPLPFAIPADAAALPVLDVDARDSSALFEKLRPLLPAGASAPPDDLPGFSGMPFVALTDAGKTLYLNTLLADAVYGESYALGIQPAAAIGEARRVKVRLTATRARALSTPLTLVEGDFGYDELAGSRLRLSPQPTVSLPVFLKSKVSEVTNFVAGLACIGSNGVPKRFVRGAALSTLGDVIDVSGKTPTVNGVPVATGGAATNVASLDVTASTVRAPAIDVEVAPRTSGGAVEAGLSAVDFVVEEDGVRVSAVVRENGGAPRVLVLWDGTGSQPVLTDAMAGGIADAITTSLPGATVQVLPLGGTPTTAFTITTALALKTALLGVPSQVASPVFGGVLQAFDAGPTFVVVFTDGDDTDHVAATQAASLTAACPIVVVGSYAGTATLKPALLEPVATGSGGVLVDAGDLSDLTKMKAALADIGKRRSDSPYRLAYVTRGGAGKHTVTVRVGGSSGSADFTLSAADVGADRTSSELVGIQLHLEMDGDVVERTLVGLPPVLLPSDADAAGLLAAGAKAVREFFVSSAWITFEGGAPTLSAWLEDALGAAIGFEPVQRAVNDGDAVAAYAAAESAPGRPLLRSLLAHTPLQSPPGIRVTERALRAAVHLTLPLTRRTSVDLLRTTRFTALGSADGAANFDATLKASLRLAIAESAMALGSTASLLEKTPLAYLAPGPVSEASLTAFPAKGRTAMAALLNRFDGHRLVAKDGSTPAFFYVDAGSGSALGVLPDGTGGAVEECQEIVDFANEQIDILGVLVGEIEAGLASVFIVIAAVGKAAAVAVAEAALSFTDPLVNPSILELGSTIVCSMLSDFLGNGLPGTTGKAVTHAGEAWGKSKVAGKITDQLPLCKLAQPCSREGRI